MITIRSIVGLVGFICGFLMAPALDSSAAIVGTNPPAQPLTTDRIASLPKAERAQWQEYLDRSTRQRIADQTFLKNELQQHGLKQTILPPAALGEGFLWTVLMRGTGSRKRCASPMSFSRSKRPPAVGAKTWT